MLSECSALNEATPTSGSKVLASTGGKESKGLQPNLLVRRLWHGKYVKEPSIEPIHRWQPSLYFFKQSIENIRSCIVLGLSLIHI